MIIKSITLGNYRLYEGKNIIKFNQDDEKPIFLISGENGFGKTTFLHSLIWCLYGRLITEVEAEVRKDIANSGYNAFLKNNLYTECTLYRLYHKKHDRKGKKNNFIIPLPYSNKSCHYHIEK